MVRRVPYGCLTRRGPTPSGPSHRSRKQARKDGEEQEERSEMAVAFPRRDLSSVPVNARHKEHVGFPPCTGRTGPSCKREF